MSRLRRVSGKAVIEILETLGFIQVRQRGSHVVLRKHTAEGDVGCVVPLPNPCFRVLVSLWRILIRNGTNKNSFRVELA